MNSTGAMAAVLHAPADWRSLDFISDLHLQRSEPATFAAWQNYMARTRAQAIFILGDLFEVWIGDDALAAPSPDGPDGPEGDSFEQRCAQVLAHAAERTRVFFMHGNRDFLVGATFARHCGVTLLDDPTTLDIGRQRWVLSHGDALCLADTDYQAFRQQVRAPQWRADFLSRPLADRMATARDLRARSEAHKRTHPVWVDLDTTASVQCLRSADAVALIHGHTHHPADHDLPDGLRRLVLSDWDLDAQPARAEVLRLHRDPLAGSAWAQRLAIAQA